ncbi:hypothetical protein CJA_2708 [Cellvibrio japonicus Ueda107]|uniref:Uncharacterized protein n=1 Tax=Cellvibrio japonicus (strain Ueda107) TaxID=498211 RepID=B3PBE1_CELJU|nr:hypothetical protein CJA_2708 [Cellvibrio japonicus Ueda107]
MIFLHRNLNQFERHWVFFSAFFTHVYTGKYGLFQL